jgi:hypothetical protein
MLERTKILTEIVTAWISMLALIIAGCFAGFQYLEKEDGERVKETLSFLGRFNTSPVLDARRKIATTWDGNMSQMIEILERKPFIDSDYRQFILKTIHDGGIGQDVALVIEYFDSLEVCIRAKICDGPAAAQFFKAEATSFFRQHYRHIQRVREERHDERFAQDLERFTKRAR